MQPDTERRPPPDRATRLLRRAVAHPFVVLALLVAVLTLPTLWAKDVWFPDEVRHAAVLRNLMDNGHWLVLHLGDSFYADKPPLYFWFLASLAWVPGSTGPAVFMAAAALSGWLFLAAQSLLGRALGLHPRTVLLAGLLLLSNWFFIERLHQPRMDLLFAAFILLAHAGFFRASTSGAKLQRGWVLFGFLMAALAALTKGPLGLVLPLAALALVLLRQRRGVLFGSSSMVLGYAVFIGIMVAYLLAVLATEGPQFVRAVLIEQTWDRAVHAPHQSEPVYWYVPQIFLAFLPWSIGVCLLPWRRLLLPESLRALFRAGHAEHEGVVYLWCTLASGLAVLSVLDYKVTQMVLLLFGPLALVSAQLLTRARRRPRQMVFAAIAILLALAALAMPFAPSWTLWPEYLHGELQVGLGLALTAGLGMLARKRGPLLFASTLYLGISLTCLPFYLITIHGLNPVMAPRALGEILAEYAGRGHKLVQFHPYYSGIFDYHAGRAVTFVATDTALDAIVSTHQCGVVAIRPVDFESWPQPPAGLRVIAQQQLDYERYMLVLWGGEDCA